MRASAISLRFLVVALMLMLGSSRPGFAQPPAKVLTAEQKEKLKERDAFWKQSLQFSSEGKLPEAIAAADRALAIERVVHGPEHREVVVTLKHRGNLHERAEDFAAAEKDRREVLRLQTKQFGAKAWQVTDARLNLQHVETLARLDAKARQELKEADQWMSKAIASNKLGKYPEGAEYAKKALAIRLSVLGEENRASALSANWTGSLWQNANQFKKKPSVL
ncbi:MAG: tetratricopeptide repeat protein [Gemmataceae bacterium]|nr:tetratricopeptide repeat protein [Gemmataceae bacterium]